VHLDVQVDAVQQRAAELALVARHLVGRAAAAALCTAPEAAGAGVHGRNQLEARRKLRAVRGAGDGDAAGLQRLAQGLQRAAAEFGEFVQEQCAVVGQGDLTGLGRRAPADQGHGAGRVVRVGGAALAPLRGLEAPAQAGDGRAFDGFLLGHGRQQAGKPVGQHGLARPGRADQQHGMAAGGGNLQGALGLDLALDLGQIQ